MSSRDPDVLVFDLDGTLADTAPDLTAALNHALGEMGRPSIAQDAVRDMVGHGARALLRKGLAATGAVSEELVDAGFPIFLDFYSTHICDGTTAFEGVEETLDALAARGIALAICTNKLEGLSRSLVAALGWTDRFPVIIGGDTLAVRKPDPAPLYEAIARSGGGRAVFVGDSITDADTARAAQVPLVAVSFGFSDRPVADLGAAVVIDHYRQLPEALLGL
jgi:phosphoglycolate phosphatase